MKHRNINLILFSVILVFLISIPFVSKNLFVTNQDAPWQFTPFNSGDSLSIIYKERYRILDQQALIHQIKDKASTTVSVMIDGWGVPYDERMLEQDFALFEENKSSFAIHKRLLGFTSHAENVEYRSEFAGGTFLMQGDSSTCLRRADSSYWEFERSFCCANCDDSKMIAVVDSLLSDSTQTKIGWTVRSTREGDREKLHEILRKLSDVVNQHPDVQFIIQGTHRPILGAPETRRMYNAKWVPAVFINCELKESSKNK